MSWLIAVPTSVTLAGVFCGLLSMILAPTNPWLAGCAIVVAALCDMVDGRLARLTGTTSEFGAELDSLADVVSFGIAPAWLAYQVLAGPELSLGWALVAFAFVACGALRLARFNVTETPTDRFVGLPIPAAALLVGCLVMAAQETGSPALSGPVPTATALAVGAVGMVSPFPFPSYKTFESKVAQVAFYVLVLAGLSLLVIDGPGGVVLFGLMALYTVVGFIAGLLGKR